MANVAEVSSWEAGIYQLETTDPVQGGVNGIDNLQAKQLANRSLWLKDKIALTDADVAALLTLSSSNQRYIRPAQLIKYHLIDTAAVYVALTAAEAPIGSIAVLYLRLANTGGVTRHQVSGNAVDISIGSNASDTAVQAMMLVEIVTAASRNVLVSYHRWTNPGFANDYCDISYGGHF